MNPKSEYANQLLMRRNKREVRGALALLLLLPLAAWAEGMPQVSTLSATTITTERATLNCTVNPDGYPTVAWFEWDTTPIALRNHTPVTDMESGTDALPLSVPLAGLTPNTTYYFRAAATNSAGAVYGTKLAFTTIGPPQVSTLSATAVTTNAATLNGAVNPKGFPTAAWFQWGTTNGYGNLTPVTDMGSGTNALAISVPLAGLTPGVVYQFRVAATNSYGAVYGSGQTFTALALPQVLTLSATAVTANGATLNSTVNPDGYPTAAWFQWGTTTSYANITPVTDMGSGTNALPLSFSLAGLTPSLSYHFRVVATNSTGGSVYGSDQVFTTLGAPQVLTLSATAVTTNAATLNGTVNPNGYATAAWFQWGTGISYGNLTPVTDMGSGTNVLPLSVPLAGLTPSTTYYFRVAATNSYGAVYSSHQVFTTRPHADTNTVTSLAESGAGSLRQVIADSAPGDSIVFGVTGTITLSSGELVVDKDLTILGPGPSVLAIGNGGRGFHVYPGVRLAVVNLTITNCWSDHGAAIYNDGGNLLVQNCLFTRNTADGDQASTNGCGGAVFNTGIASIESTTFVSNSAAGAPAIDWTWPGGTGGAGYGGALYNLGNLELRNSTFVTNSVGGGQGAAGSSPPPSGTVAERGQFGGPGGDGNGGALFNAGVATVVNCTFTGNRAHGGLGGAGGKGGDSLYSNYPPKYLGGAGGGGGKGGAACGAIYDTDGLCSLKNCTIASNSGFGGAGGPGGPGGHGGLGDGPAGGTGIDGNALGSLRGAGVLLLNNVLSSNAPGGNASGTITDGGHNLSSDASCAFTNSGSMNNTDPKLVPLADNGGPTPTMALLPGSPAIDAGNTSLAPTIDQRGFPRPAGSAADIGAYEYGSMMPTLTASISETNSLNILASGNTGRTCRLLVSPDMRHWVAIATNQIGSDGTFLFYDDCAAAGICRFYRLVMP
jgi:hypothetical protein